MRTEIATLPYTRPTLVSVCDKDLLHRYLMMLAGQQPMSTSPRAAGGVQGRVDLPGDALASASGEVLVRWRCGGGSTVIDGQRLTVQVRLSAVSRRDGKVTSPWGDDQAWDKVVDLFARHGFVLDDEDGELPMIIGPMERRAGIITRDVSARLQIVDVERARAAFDNGIGRSKNYGCGMLVTV